MKRHPLSARSALAALVAAQLAAPGAALADATAANTARVLGLKPNWSQLLSVSLTPTAQPVVKDGRVADSAKVVICTSEKVTAGLDQWVSEGAILNPGSTTVWPGALLIGDRALAQGAPTPLIVPRAPVTIRVNLPGLGSEGTRTVANPTNVSVNNAVGEIVNHWLKTRAKGFTPGLRAFSQAQKSWSQSQIAVDMGFSAQWTSGSASAAMKAQSSSESTVTMKSFKQIYYSVDIEEAGPAGSFFAPDYTLTASDVSDTAPPTYVRSVDYGRLIIAQMQVDKAMSETDAEAAMEYASSATVKGNVSANVKNAAESAQFRVIAIGGGARRDDAIELFSGDFAKFRDAIRAGFVFSADNPAQPIAYTVASLDRVQRLMNATTTYVKSDCQEFPNRSVELKSTGWFVSKFKVSWIEPSGPNGLPMPKIWFSGDKTSPYASGRIYIPGDATAISIVGQNYTGLAWDKLRTPLNLKGGDLSRQNSCFKLKGTTLSPSYETC